MSRRLLTLLAAEPRESYLPAMSAHSHQLHQGTSLRDAAARRMVERGEQWTDMRASVFDALAGFDKPASAYDIAEAVSKARGKRVAANSVYRILDLFVGTNLARRVESANAYVANQHPACLHDCIFLICDAHRRRQAVRGRANSCRTCRFRRGAAGDRGPRPLRGLQLGLAEQ